MFFDKNCVFYKKYVIFLPKVLEICYNKNKGEHIYEYFINTND